MCIIPGSTPFVNPFSLDILPDIFGLSQRFLRYSLTIYYMAYGKCRSQRYAELGAEPTGEGNSGIKTCRLDGAPSVTSSRSAGRGRRKTRVSAECCYLSGAFVQMVMWRHIRASGSRFDVLFPVGLTVTTSLAVATVSQTKNSRLSYNQSKTEQCREMSLSASHSFPRVSPCTRCVRFRRDLTAPYPSQGVSRCVEALWAIVNKNETLAKSVHRLHHCLQRESPQKICV